ncbi:ABC transporter permease [Cytobacillus horneckiae]|uniref:ABC transporter permease n=1 Tax=Cytobacillus horneckiae TaxID=549687 RepID=UPI003D9A7E4E
MNIFRIFIKEMKSNFRDSQTFIFFLAFPIILMTILGTALTNAFTDGVTIDNELKILYKNEGNKELAVYFKAFTSEAFKHGFQFAEENNADKGITAVKENEVAAFIVLGNEGVDVYGSDINTIESGVIQGLMAGFANQYSLLQQKINPVIAEEIPNDFILTSSLNGKEQPDSMDYYAVSMAVMLSFFSLYASYQLFRGEKTLKTSVRLIAAPITKGEVLIGKMAGSFTMNAFFILVLIFFSKYVFGAEWGEHLWMVLMILFSLILFAICLGIAISFVAKTPEATASISIFFVQIACFLGGVYFPIDTSSGSLFSFFASLSPLTWSNEALREIIFAQNVAAGYPVILINIVIAAACFFIAVWHLHRQEGL